MTAGVVSLIIPGPEGRLAMVAMGAARDLGCSPNAALLYARIVSFGGAPSWEMRRSLREVVGRSTRQITRYFAELHGAGLLKSAPIAVGHRPPGANHDLPYRPWLRWAIGLPDLREAVKIQAREAFTRWQRGFREACEQRAHRNKFADLLGKIWPKPKPQPKPTSPSRADVAREVERRSPRRWTAEELDAELERQANERASATGSDTGPPDTS